LAHASILDIRFFSKLVTAASFAVVVGLCGCDEAPPAPRSGALPPDPQSAASAPDPVTSTAALPTRESPRSNAHPVPSREELVEAARELLTKWRKAQNDHDFDAYIALYDPATFTGLKRVGDEMKKYDFAGWRHDREGMFKSSIELATENEVTLTWNEVSRLKEGLVEVEFVQRFRSARYADHGPKRLLLWQAAPTAPWRIVSEEMLVSRAGWSDETARAEFAKRVEIEVAALDEQTERGPTAGTLKRLAVTMQTAELLGQRLAQTPYADAFADAIAELGELECLNHLEFERCGGIEHDWGKVETATIAHPCVRRAVLLPLLESGRLDKTTLDVLEPRLTAVLRSESPDEELVTALLPTLKRHPPASVVPFASALVRAPHPNPKASQIYTQLAPADALALAKRFQSVAPIEHLDPSAYFEAFYALDLGAATLESSLVLPAVERLRQARRVKDLRTYVDDPRCDVAMAAAAALATLGDATHLPQWSRATTPAFAAQTVCRLLHDPDVPRRDAELRKFIDPKRVVRRYYVTDTEEDDMEASKQLHEAAEAEMTPAEHNLIERLPELRNTHRYTVRRAREETRTEVGIGVLLDPDAFSEFGSKTLGFVKSDAGMVLDFVGHYEFIDLVCPC
jgi:hypothetical protein